MLSNVLTETKTHNALSLHDSIPTVQIVSVCLKILFEANDLKTKKIYYLW